MLFVFLFSVLQVAEICSAATSTTNLDKAIAAVWTAAKNYAKKTSTDVLNARVNPYTRFANFLTAWKTAHTPAPVAPQTPSHGHRFTGRYSPPVRANRVPSAPAITSENAVYSYTYLDITAVSTDPDNDRISYRFEWTASKNGDTHIKESDFIPSGTPYTDRFKYSAKDIGYTYTVEVIATDGYDDSYSSWHSFLIMPRMEDFSVLTGDTNTPAPTLFNGQSGTLFGSVTFDENLSSSPLTLYGAVGDNYIYVWAGLAALFIVLGVYAYYTYTGKNIISDDLKRSIYHYLSRSGIKGTERTYDYELTYGMSEPKKNVSYRRTPIKKRRVKW